MLMTSSGQSIRIRVAEVRETGRNAQGVKLLTLKDGEKLQDISIVIPDGEDAEGAPSITGGEEVAAADDAAGVAGSNEVDGSTGADDGASEPAES